MADTFREQTSGAGPIAEDDPFAELTRIMGFDPRDKVQRPKQAEPDFELDLERELLGEFENDNVVSETSSALAEPHIDDVVQEQQESLAVPVDAAPDNTFDFSEAANEFVLGESVSETKEAAASDPFADFQLDFDEQDASPESEILSGYSSDVEPALPVSEFSVTASSPDVVLTNADAPAAEYLARDDAALAQEHRVEPIVAAEAEELDPASGDTMPAASEHDELDDVVAALEAWQDSGAETEAASDDAIDGALSQSADINESVETIDQRADPVSRVDDFFSLGSRAKSKPQPSDAAVVESQQDTEIVSPISSFEAVADNEAAEAMSPDASAPFRESVVPANSPEDFEGTFEADLARELNAAELAQTPSGGRDVFTAEDGWLDDGRVSLHEPIVLIGADEQDEVVKAEDLSVSTSGAHSGEAVEAHEALNAEPVQHDAEFEQELFDLLDGEMASQVATTEPAAAHDDWLDDMDFVAESGSEEKQSEAFVGDNALFESLRASGAVQDATSSSDLGSDGSAPHAEGPASDLDDDDFSKLLAEELETYEGVALADENDRRPDHDVTSSHDMEIGAAIDDLGPIFEDASHADDALASSDLPNPPSVPSDMEPEIMQPFDERAFDAALADEFADDRYLDTPLNADTTASHSASFGYGSASRTIVNAPSMEAPEIETSDFLDQRLAHSDELDLPEVDYGREPPRAAHFDDFDADFAAAFNDLNNPAQKSPTAGQQSQTSDPNWEDHIDYSMGGTVAAAAAAGASAGSYGGAYSRAGMYEPDEQADYYDRSPRSEAKAGLLGRRNTLLAGVAAAVLLFGGIAWFALPGGTGSSGEPAVIRADSDPMKVRPENPGGATVPNQDNVVYDRVGSGQPLGAPQQERLISRSETPVDLSAQNDELAEGLAALEEGADDADLMPKVEDRLTPDLASAEAPVAGETVAVAPRRVRTMVVRPDGTLAPRDEPASASAEPAVSAAAAVTSEPPVMPQQPVQPSQQQQQQPQQQATQPAAEPAPEQTAAAPATPTPPTVNAGATSGWSVQIASQPSEASAQASHQDLARRYSSVLNGRTINIVRADIEGRGTYYRVRVAASSRAEANQICTSYKNAGGSCFVSQ